MFYDMFGAIRKQLTKERSLTKPSISTLSPSSQVCYDITDNKPIGSCIRQVWFDKTNKQKTNPISLKAKMAGFSGNWWEDWMLDQVKQLGLFDDTQITATESLKMVKGFIDLSFTNPLLEGKLELGEIKTYDASNYVYGQAVYGTAKVQPKPKISHLLQAFRYLLIYRHEVEAINLFYIDRACGDWYKNKQFRVTIIEVKGNLYPKVETVWNNEYLSYVENTISDSGIELAEDTLIEHLREGTTPPRDYIPVYSEDMIESLFGAGKISKYAYDRHSKDPDGYPLGDMQCSFCPFNKGTCEAYD